MIPPTPVLARGLDAIRRLSADGVPPSYAELRDELGLTGQGSVQNLVMRMAERGLITYEPRRARSIRIVGDMPGLEQRSTDDLRTLRNRINEILKGRAS